MAIILCVFCRDNPAEMALEVFGDVAENSHKVFVCLPHILIGLQWTNRLTVTGNKVINCLNLSCLDLGMRRLQDSYLAKYLK